MLHAANMLRATEIHTWGCDAATVRWLHPKDGGTRLSVSHLKDGGSTYDDALSRLSDAPRFLLLMLPTDLAATLRRVLDGSDGQKLGWEAVTDGTLLALLHRGTADGCRWDALVPHVTGCRTYMRTPLPQGHSRPVWDDFIAGFHDHGILPDNTWQAVQQKALGRDYRRRIRARLLELRDPLCQRWDDLWLRLLDPCSPASHLPHTCHLCRECNTVFSATPTGANRCAHCSQVAACFWPEPPAGPRRRTEEEALQRRIEGTQIPSHSQAGPAGAAFLWIHVHLRDPTSVAHLSHVIAPRPPPDPTPCRARSTMPGRRGNRPEHARARRRVQEATVRGPVAGAVAESHAAHAAALDDPAGSARTFPDEAALQVVRALNRAGALALLPAMHRAMNAV